MNESGSEHTPTIPQHHGYRDGTNQPTQPARHGFTVGHQTTLPQHHGYADNSHRPGYPRRHGYGDSRGTRRYHG